MLPTHDGWALYLLNKTGVAGVPGEAFFHGPEESNLIRFCFAKPVLSGAEGTDEELEEGCRRLAGL